MVTLDQSKCTNCMRCYDVCSNYVYSKGADNKQLELLYPEQCYACGHCVMVCKSKALAVDGFATEDIKTIKPNSIDPSNFEEFLLTRRSIRDFKDQPVPTDIISKLINSGVHAGTSSNGQSEDFIVIQNQEFLQELELMVVDTLWNAGLKFLDSNIMKRVMELKYGKAMVKQYSVYHHIIKNRRKNNDVKGMVFREAPTVIVAHGVKTNFLAQTNCAIALRNMELFASTLGLGTCWIGFLASAANKNDKINTFLEIPSTNTVLGTIIVGYPKHTYSSVLPRKEREIRWIK